MRTRKIIKKKEELIVNGELLIINDLKETYPFLKTIATGRALMHSLNPLYTLENLLRIEITSNWHRKSRHDEMWFYINKS